MKYPFFCLLVLLLSGCYQQYYYKPHLSQLPHFQRRHDAFAHFGMDPSRSFYANASYSPLKHLGFNFNHFHDRKTEEVSSNQTEARLTEFGAIGYFQVEKYRFGCITGGGYGRLNRRYDAKGPYFLLPGTWPGFLFASFKTRHFYVEPHFQLFGDGLYFGVGYRFGNLYFINGDVDVEMKRYEPNHFAIIQQIERQTVYSINELFFYGGLEFGPLALNGGVAYGGLTNLLINKDVLPFEPKKDESVLTVSAYAGVTINISKLFKRRQAGLEQARFYHQDW